MAQATAKERAINIMSAVTTMLYEVVANDDELRREIFPLFYGVKKEDIPIMEGIINASN